VTPDGTVDDLTALVDRGRRHPWGRGVHLRGWRRSSTTATALSEATGRRSSAPHPVAADRWTDPCLPGATWLRCRLRRWWV